MNKKIDCISELTGEYNIKVVEGSNTIYESGWCRNTILSGGLQSLYNKGISSLTDRLDLGKSTSSPGISGYHLNGIISNPESSTFLNIPRSNHSIYTEKDTKGDSSVRVFYSYFASNVADTAQSFSEFAIRQSNNKNAFARNTFKTTVYIKPEQYIVMEYRMKVRRSYAFSYKLPFITSTGQSFTVPCSGVCFNIPYDEMYRNDNELILLDESSSLPAFGAKWPVLPIYAVRNRSFSTFKPTEIGYNLDKTTRTFTVSTVFSNISAQSFGLYNRINTLLLSRNSQQQFAIGLPNSAFVGIKLQFPLALFNYENNFFGISGISTEQNSSVSVYQPYNYYNIVTARYNMFNIGINYTWREVS